MIIASSSSGKLNFYQTFAGHIDVKKPSTSTMCNQLYSNAPSQSNIFTYLFLHSIEVYRKGIAHICYAQAVALFGGFPGCAQRVPPIYVHKLF